MGMAEAEEGVLNVTRHWDVDGVLYIVPLQGESTILCGIPIFSDLVMVVEGSEEVHDIVPVGVLDGKVINY